MSHQDRRAPLPAEYQYPTHGVDCDCPTCRNRVIRSDMIVLEQMMVIEGLDRIATSYTDTFDDRIRPTYTAYGWGV